MHGEFNSMRPGYSHFPQGKGSRQSSCMQKAEMTQNACLNISNPLNLTNGNQASKLYIAY